MFPSDPLDPADRLLAPDLPGRLVAAGAGIALCVLAAAQGLPSAPAPIVRSIPSAESAAPTAPMSVSALRPVAVPPWIVRDAGTAIGATRPVRTSARTATPAPAMKAVAWEPGAAEATARPLRDERHRWSSVLGFAPDALGGFEDLRVAASELVAPLPDAFVVMIDPGHGGTDPGAIAPNGLLEKELTADIALRVRRFLSEVDGIDVRLTREGDTGLSRQGRVDRIRGAGADLVVSLHFNHLPQTYVTLVESFYAAAGNIEESRAIRRAARDGAGGEYVQLTAPDLSFTEGSERLAGLMQRRVFGEVVHENPDATDAGIKPETLFVLTRSLVPGALIELTCLSNPGEAERLESEAYRDRLAAALADAVRDYRDSLETRPLGSLDT